jgi:hypothetical protein
METTPQNVSLHTGSCHCNAVRFTVLVDPSSGTRCNCSVCTKISSIGALLKPDAFTLLAGEGNLSTYEWGMKVGRRFFCKTCGVHCFSRGFLKELGGDFVSVNLNTLDDVDMGRAAIGYWDGRHNNWQAGMRKEPWPIFTA